MSALQSKSHDTPRTQDRLRRYGGLEHLDDRTIRPAMTINGKRAEAVSSVQVINPATEDIVGFCPSCEKAQLEAAVESARQAFATWRTTAFGERRKQVLAFAHLIEEHREELARLLVLEQGKPLARAAGEIASAVNHCRAFADMVLDVELLENTAQKRVELHRRPIGVVAAIIPWNYPVLLAMWKIAPALLTGNTVIVKPATSAPLTILRLGELAQEVLPAGVLSVLSGEEAGPGLVGHHAINKIAFTGSTATGKKIMAAGSANLKRLTLELGGNDAGIVLDDIDLEKAAEELFWAAFSNCGQVCAGLKRLYVPDRLYDKVCEALVRIADKAVVGDGRVPDVQMGPIQNRSQYRRIVDLVDDARSKGGVVISGGEPFEGKGFFYPPTLIRDVTDGVRVVDEEPFGPVLPIVRYSDVPDAIRRANASPYGLGASVWGTNTGRAWEIAAQLEVGSAWVNQHPSMGANIPFGGIKEFGVGVELSKYGLQAYTEMFVLNAKGNL